MSDLQEIIESLDDEINGERMEDCSISGSSLRRKLPKDIRHGSAAAVRHGCSCEKCRDKLKKMKKRGAWK